MLTTRAMQKKSRKAPLIIGLILLTVVSLFFVGRYMVFNKIKLTILNEIEGLRREGFKIHYHAIVSDHWINEVSIQNLQVSHSIKMAGCADSITHLNAGLMKIEGIEILSLIFSNTIHVGNILLEHPFVSSTWNEQLRMAPARGANKYRRILIDHFQIDSAFFELYDSSSCSLGTRASFNLQVFGIRMPDTRKSFMTWEADGVSISAIEMLFPHQFYSIVIREIKYLRKNSSIHFDSLNLFPNYNKRIFAQKSQHQTDRIECHIPSLEMSGIEIDTLGNPSIRAKLVTLMFELKVFRDRKYPDVSTTLKALPSRMFKDLPIKLQIDTLQVHHSTITYDEFPTVGDQPGRISFEGLAAMVHNLSNTSPKDMTMKTRSKFMGSGDLKADFTFPANPDKMYEAMGTLTDFDMKKMNTMLVPAARIEVKSGLLGELSFNFKYNNERSDGTLTMRYTDLKIASLSKHPGDNSEKGFQTMILNTFVISDDMGERGEKGTIFFYRDPHRAVFNYWWKSIRSGILSLYHLDKVMKNPHNEKKMDLK